MSTTYVAIDIETTGLDATNDAIIEVAAITFRDDEILDEFASLVHPHRDIPPYITRLTGITQAMVEDAPTMFSLRSRLRPVLGDHVLIGHNVDFDLAFLRAERLALGNHRLDTLTLAAILLPKAGRYSLDALGRYLNLPGPGNGQAHRALDDAEQTVELFLALRERARELGIDQLEEMVAAGRRLGWPEALFFEEALAGKARHLFTAGQETGRKKGGRLPRLFEPPKLMGRSLMPAEQATPLDVAMVAGLICPGGNFSRAFAGFEYRPQQVEMLQAVTTAFNQGGYMLVEAGTGTGKCLTGDTWITFRSGRRIQLKELCQAPIIPTEPLLCITPAGKLTYQKMRAIHANGIHAIWRLRTGLGRTITATANHPFLTMIGWQQLHGLKLGDRIATIRRLPAGTESLPAHENFIVGVMLGDGGCIYPASLNFTNFDPDIVATVREEVDRLDNVRMVNTKRKGTYGFQRLRRLGHERSGLNLLLEKLDIVGRSARSKHIPAPYFQADAETISRLLAGLWITDGSIESRDGHPSITLTSERMIREIQHLLLKLNIIARLRYRIVRLNGKEFEAWALIISDLESKRAFWQSVGQHMVGEKKRHLESWWETHSEQQHNPNEDLLPSSTWELVDEERRYAGKSWYAIRKKCIVSSDRTRGISRAKMQAIGKFLESAKLREVATSDLYWDRIVSIEPVGEAATFDLTMEGEPNFVANDIVVNNSIAYLLPAAFWAYENGRRVVISTNTINLQDQLIHKDLPELQKILPFELRAAVRKGRSNYLCTRLFQQMRHSGPSNADEMALYARILLWLPQTETGDVAELNLRTPGERLAWSRLNGENATCTLEHCVQENCPLHIARRRAEQAHIVIVNHSLLLSDVANNNHILPEFKDLIIDEAHHLEAAVTDGLSFRADKRFLEAILDEITKPRSGLIADLQHRTQAVLPGELRDKIDEFVNRLRQEAQSASIRLDEFFTTLSYFLQGEINRRSQFAEQIRLTPAIRAQPGYSEVEISWDNLHKHLRVIGDGFARLAGALADIVDSYDIEDGEDLRLALISNARSLEETRATLDMILADPRADMICWVEVFKERISLHAAPLHVGPLVEKHVFQTKETVVLTSATLRTAGPNDGNTADFVYIRDRLHARDADELAVGSPFDYKKATLLYLATDIPEPNQPGYQRYLEEAIIEVAKALGGRTMVLFTAYGQLNQTVRAVEGPLNEAGITVLAQSEGTSRQQLLDHFKREDSHSVLLGTRSFWEGVDVPGPALQAVLIAKLPFDVPSDPIFAARSETFDNSFFDYSVPEAVLRFRQGFGRLIRRQSDEGVVVILDKRVLTKRYGQMFLDSLPECTVIRQRIGRLGELTLRWLNREK